MKRSEFIWLVLQEAVKFATVLVFRRRPRSRNKKEKVVLGDGKLRA